MGIHLSSYVVNVSERVGSTFAEALAAGLTGGLVFVASGTQFAKSALGIASIQALYSLAKCIAATPLPPVGSPALFGLPAPKGGHSMGATAPPTRS